MERSKHTINGLIITLILLTLTPDVHAESPYKKIIYSEFVNREMYNWGGVIRTMETNKYLKTIEQKLELINYYYGYIAYLIGKKQNDIALNMINKGEKLINQVLHTSPGNPTAYSYKGSFIGFRIGISKFKSIYLGHESSANVGKAYTIDPQNIQAIIDKGNILFYSPALLGGDKEEALHYFLKGARLLEKNKDTDHNWVYLNLLTTTALAYEKINKPQEAKLIYQKILRHEPRFKWVRDELYPRLLLKMNS